MYESFRILIDDPAPEPGLGFDDYAASLAEIIRLSHPQFAVGIFGAWGSGKTTLMKAIQHDLNGHPEVVGVWFNAWRYEKEEHLIVPLLDTVREELIAWGAREGTSEETGTRARRMASAIGKATRAILAGLTLSTGLPGAIELSLDANKVATAWRQSDQGNESALEPKSFYHASFMALKQATEEFIPHDQETEEGPERRFVVFIDDLDRCLPDKALQVLESMKLFFDLEGFVFVVGLDQQVIERAVQVKYPVPGISQGDTSTYISGVDYVKKIFQVQFTTPRIDQGQLPVFLDAIADAAQLPPEQRNDLRNVVTPQVSYLAGNASVNPREIKRLVNAYTMQIKMLERKLLEQQRAPSAPAVLALQVMSFRPDWQPIYQALSNWPSDFVDATSNALAGGPTAVALGEEIIELPPSLVAYLRAEGAPLLNLGDDLEVYVSTLEAAQSTDPLVREAAQALGRLRVAHRTAQASTATTVAEALSDVIERLGGRQSFPEVMDTMNGAREVQAAFPAEAGSRIDSVPQGSDEYNGYVAALQGWLERVGGQLPAIGQAVADLRRRTLTSSATFS